jgi:hypothetical protein
MISVSSMFSPGVYASVRTPFACAGKKDDGILHIKALLGTLQLAGELIFTAKCYYDGNLPQLTGEDGRGVTRGLNAESFSIMLAARMVNRYEVMYGGHHLCDQLPPGVLVYTLGLGFFMRLVGVLFDKSASLNYDDSAYLPAGAKLCDVDLEKQVPHFVELHAIAEDLLGPTQRCGGGQ